MLVTSHKLRGLLVICTVSLLLNACSAVSYKPTPTEQSPAAADIPAPLIANKGGEVSTEPVLTINPYVAMAANVPVAAQTRFTEALGLLKENKLSAAEAGFSSLTRDYPSLSGPWLNLGLISLRSDRRGLAKTQFERAIEINKHNLNARNQLAIMFREDGDFAAAEQHYLQALNVWPDHANSQRNLGILYDLYMGRHADALQHYQRAQSLAPSRQMKGWIADLKRRMAKAEQ
jgi:tetratricopeptide (TPR) repeat protein